MKKILIALGILLLVTGCFLTTKKSEVKEFKLDGYGSFTISDNYMIREDHSTKDKPFFVDKKDEHSSRPNNISVNGGTNYYSIDQVDSFKSAIFYQMANQAKAYNATLTSSGSTTTNGYPLLRFNLEGKDQKAIQYYIMGDHKYVMVYATIFEFDDEESVIEEAEYIANSFIWE
ncbi:MAG: lipoprotein [Bacilli bacterium]|nr:lipoprotein [Bacilli bacterium]